MTCEELCEVLCSPMAAATKMSSTSSSSSNFGWTEKRRRRRASPQQHRPLLKLKTDPERLVVSGMLPTLQALAELSSESEESHNRGVCLMPQEENADAASHLQTTLLEAYCRQIGLRIVRLPQRVLEKVFGREHPDLSCLLILGGKDDFFLESPE